MRIAVVASAYNEAKVIEGFVEAIFSQTKMPDEVVVVDDGSKDKTSEILERLAKKHPRLKVIKQKNAGPAAARNKAWKNADAEICVFTDADCVPEKNWIEKLLKPFSDLSVGATAGTYKTINEENLLARFVGLEIAWKYRNVRGEIDAHGTYNLAVRKSVLEEVGGLDESYPMPSGEDWDMTYKISRKHKIMFVPETIVGHYHPEDFWWYMKNQVRRGFDRIKLYNDNPENAGSDVYTGKSVKYQVWMAGISIPSLILFYPFFKNSFLVPALIFSFLVFSSFSIFLYILKRDIKAAVVSVPIILARNYAWFLGMIQGMKEFGFIKIIFGVLKSGM